MASVSEARPNSMRPDQKWSSKAGAERGGEHAAVPVGAVHLSLVVPAPHHARRLQEGAGEGLGLDLLVDVGHQQAA